MSDTLSSSNKIPSSDSLTALHGLSDRRSLVGHKSLDHPGQRTFVKKLCGVSDDSQALAAMFLEKTTLCWKPKDSSVSHAVLGGPFNMSGCVHDIILHPLCLGI